MQSAWVLSIGTELALGQSVDTNGPWLAQQLARLGIRTDRLMTLTDDPGALAGAFQEAFAAADVVIATGGLGPTADDLTRSALAAALADELVLDADSLAEIEAFFASRGRTMPERNKVQAERPRRATPITNTCGTAPGIAVTYRPDCWCYVTPGVPFEMKAMFDLAIRPRLAAATGGEVLVSRRLQTYGMGESDVGERLRDLMQRGRNPEVGTTAKLGIIGIRINARAESAAAADALLHEAETEIGRRLGPIIFGRGEEELPDAVARMLVERGESVALAESCTGGLLGKLLTDRPGSSAYFRGGVIAYSNESKQHLVGVPPDVLETAGAVSAATAEALVDNVRQRFGSTYGISVTGIAGPGGGTPDKPVGLVYIGLATPDGVLSFEQRFGDMPRDVIRHRSAHHAFHKLWVAMTNSATLRQ